MKWEIIFIICLQVQGETEEFRNHGMGENITIYAREMPPHVYSGNANANQGYQPIHQ